MSDLHDVLVRLVGMSPEERRAAFAEHAAVLFGGSMVEHVQRQLSEAAADAASISSAGKAWKRVPDFIVEAFADGAQRWAEGVDAVWNEMVAFAQEASRASAASPAPATRAAPSAPSGRGTARAQPVPDTFVDTAPTEDEILQDHLDYVRHEQENFDERLDYDRVRDDDISYSTPSYDSFDPYDPY